MTTISSFAALKLLGSETASKNNLSTELAQLGARQKLIRAGDDVAASSIADTLQSQLSGLRQGQFDLQRDNTALQIAGERNEQITSITERMQLLASQASSEGVSDSERGFLNTEFQSLKAEIDRLSNDVTQFQIATGGATDPLAVQIPNVDSTSLFGSSDFDLLTVDGAAGTQDILSKGLDTLQTASKTISENRELFDNQIASVNDSIQEITLARSNLDDIDSTQSSTDLALSQLLRNPNGSTQVQSNNLQPAILDFL